MRFITCFTVLGRRHARLSVAAVSVRDIRDSMDDSTSKKKPFSVEAARERSLEGLRVYGLSIGRTLLRFSTFVPEVSFGSNNVR